MILRSTTALVLTVLVHALAGLLAEVATTAKAEVAVNAALLQNGSLYDDWGRYIVTFEAAYMALLSNLIVQDPSALPHGGKEIPILDDGRVVGSIDCTPMLHAEMPFELQELCCYDNLLGTLLTPDMCHEYAPCPAEFAYDAYIQWCGPSLCHQVSPKKTYIQVLQVASALGGLWGLVTLVIVFFIWNCLVLGLCVWLRPNQQNNTASPASKGVA